MCHYPLSSRVCEAMHAVDLPAVGYTDLTSASEQYLSSLESRPRDDEWFQSSPSSKVAIIANNVRRLRLFEDDQPDCTLLTLHPPDDPTQVVAVHLHEKWWCVDDVLHTSSKSRIGLMLVTVLFYICLHVSVTADERRADQGSYTGLNSVERNAMDCLSNHVKKVHSTMERVIVFLLSQVVDRSSQEEALFSLHPPTESCKLLWRDSQAVGFYSFKHKGSLCDSWSSRCYLLPVLDTVLVRRSCRRRGFGLQMLEDFCSSFSTERFLGVSAPLSPSMVAVCRNFLQQHEEHRERLYEVEAPGDWTQRRNIWLNIQLGRYSLRTGINEESRPTSGETQGSEADDSLPEGSTTQQMKSCDLTQGGHSPGSMTSGTGYSRAAHADDLDSGPPTRPPHSLNTKQAVISEPSLSAEERRSKRARRT